MQTRSKSGINKKKNSESTSTPQRRATPRRANKEKSVTREEISPLQGAPIRNETFSPSALEIHPAMDQQQHQDPPLQNDGFNDEFNQQQGPDRRPRPDLRAMKESVFPTLEGVQSPILCPPVAANSFDLKTGLLNLVSSSQFSGGSLENPNAHLNSFNQIMNTTKMNGVPYEALCLRAFPFSLAGKAKDWLWSHPGGYFTSWDALAKAFLVRFFPPAKTNHYRSLIYNFEQLDGESLYEAWERFKQYLRTCSHHALPLDLVVQRFYNGLDAITRARIDQGAGGMFMDLNPEEGQALIEKMSCNAFQWGSERGGVKRNNRDLCAAESSDAYGELSRKFDQLLTSVQSLGTNQQLQNSRPENQLQNSSGTQDYCPPQCERCYSIGHDQFSCPMFGSADDQQQMEDVNYMGRQNVGAFGWPSNPLYSSNNRNHPNFSLKTQDSSSSPFIAFSTFWAGP